jgi:hypothetical protein
MHSIFSIALVTLIASTMLNAAEPVKMPPKEKFKIYLLMGQSNMAGRGEVGKIDKTPHARVLRLNNKDQWVEAVEPITLDEHKVPGVGPGLAFGKVMAEADPSVMIGLVPTAVGGTPLSRWEKGADLYENAVKRARVAMKDGTLAGVLWHQGESDTAKPEQANTYEARLTKMIADLRADLNAPNLPFVMGELGRFFSSRAPRGPLAKVVDAALNDIAKKVPLTGCASSQGLKDKGDQLHFDNVSQREFGKRYAEIMLKLEAAAHSPKAAKP